MSSPLISLGKCECVCSPPVPTITGRLAPGTVGYPYYVFEEGVSQYGQWRNFPAYPPPSPYYSACAAPNCALDNLLAGGAAVVLANIATIATPPFDWTITHGTLPPGLKITPNGEFYPGDPIGPFTATLSGIPTKSGSFAFTIEVRKKAPGAQPLLASGQAFIFVGCPMKIDDTVFGWMQGAFNPVPADSPINSDPILTWDGTYEFLDTRFKNLYGVPTYGGSYLGPEYGDIFATGTLYYPSQDPLPFSNGFVLSGTQDGAKAFIFYQGHPTDAGIPNPGVTVFAAWLKLSPGILGTYDLDTNPVFAPTLADPPATIMISNALGCT